MIVSRGTFTFSFMFSFLFLFTDFFFYYSDSVINSHNEAACWRYVVPKHAGASEDTYTIHTENLGQWGLFSVSYGSSFRVEGSIKEIDFYSYTWSSVSYFKNRHKCKAYTSIHSQTVSSLFNDNCSIRYLCILHGIEFKNDSFKSKALIFIWIKPEKVLFQTDRWECSRSSTSKEFPERYFL